MNYLPFRPDVKTIRASRKPTQSEIKFGLGARWYADFDVELWKHKDGKPKKWIKSDFDGLRYYR